MEPWIDAQATAAYINNDLQTLDRLLPPKSHFYLAQIDGEFVGCGAIKYLDEKRGEIKRMFVQDRMRGKGLGKQILTQLIADGRSLGYEAIVLDSPNFCKQAHLLYAAQGFREIGPYAGAENPEEIHHRLKFMQLDLS